MSTDEPGKHARPDDDPGADNDVRMDEDTTATVRPPG